MDTKDLYRLLGGNSNFDRLIASRLGQRLLKRAEQEGDALERKAQGARGRFSTPHVEVVRRRIAEARAADLLANDAPAISKFEAARTAASVSHAAPQDFGLRRAALHIAKVWEADKDGVLTVADLARLRAHFVGEYPRSTVRTLFDNDLAGGGFHTLDTRRLRQIAAQVKTQDDYNDAIEDNGLGGADVRSQRARSFILACVSRLVGRRAALAAVGVAQKERRRAQDETCPLCKGAGTCPKCQGKGCDYCSSAMELGMCPRCVGSGGAAGEHWTGADDQEVEAGCGYRPKKKGQADDDLPEGDACQMCGGPLVELGVLGDLRHLRCRNCGAQFSRPAGEEPAGNGGPEEVEGAVGVDAVKPPNVSDATMKELLQKEKAGDIENAWAVAWTISEKKGSRRRAKLVFRPGPSGCDWCGNVVEAGVYLMASRAVGSAFICAACKPDYMAVTADLEGGERRAQTEPEFRPGPSGCDWCGNPNEEGVYVYPIAGGAGGNVFICRDCKGAYEAAEAERDAPLSPEEEEAESDRLLNSTSAAKPKCPACGEKCRPGEPCACGMDVDGVCAGCGYRPKKGARCVVATICARELQAAGASDAGEGELHPDVNEQVGEDAVDADKVVKGGRRRAQTDDDTEFAKFVLDRLNDMTSEAFSRGEDRPIRDRAEQLGTPFAKFVLDSLSDMTSESFSRGEDRDIRDKCEEMLSRQGRRASDKPTEPEFKPAINPQQPDQIDLDQADAEVRAEARKRGMTFEQADQIAAELDRRINGPRAALSLAQVNRIKSELFGFMEEVRREAVAKGKQAQGADPDDLPGEPAADPDDFPCENCHGTGACPSCDGGFDYDTALSDEGCSECGGEGDCGECGGSGTQAQYGKTGRKAAESMTFGTMPSKEAFEAAFDREVPSGRYQMDLRGSDARAAEQAGVEWYDGMSSDDLYAIVKQLADDGGDETGSLASSIMGTLGFEWI